jgi:hypothetical protein
VEYLINRIADPGERRWLDENAAERGSGGVMVQGDQRLRLSGRKRARHPRPWRM